MTRKKLTRREFEKKTHQILSSMQMVTKPFADDSEEAKHRRRERGRTDVEWFLKTYLPHYFTKPFGKIHHEILKLLYSGGKSLYAEAWPREHGKSTFTSFGVPIHQAIYEISPYTIIISDTSDLAAEFIGWIKIEFEQNPRIRQDFGDLVTYGMWEEGDIVVGGKARIRGIGARQKIRGTRFMQYRVKLIIPDDLENDINVKNKKLVKATLKWLLGAVYGSLDDDGVLMMVGTMLAKISVLSLLVHHIQEKAEVFERKFGIKRMYAAVYGAIKSDGTPLWPEGKSIEKLNQIKEMVGPIVWAADHMNNPIDEGIIRIEWFKYYQKDIEILIPKSWAYFSGTDPSARHGETHDFKAHVVNAKDPDSNILYVAEAFIRRCSIHEMNEAFVQLYYEYRMLAAGFEVNGYQLHIKDDLDELCLACGFYPNIVEITHSTDKVMRVSRLAAPIQKHRIQFIKGHSDQDILVEQLNALGSNEKDDGPDALEMAVHVSENRAAKFAYLSAGSRVMGGSSRRMTAGLRGHAGYM